MHARSHAARAWVAALLLVALLLGGQAAGDALYRGSQASAAGLLGRTGFAYLAGVRRLAAAVLWARLDPVNDAFYHDVPLGKKAFLLPSIRLVTLLDPELQDPYYVGPFILHDGGHDAEAIALAQDGVRNNSHSALLHASFAQLLMTDGRLSEARREAEAALNGTWGNAYDEFNMLTTLEVVFNKTGAPDKAAAVAAERERIGQAIRSGTAPPPK